MEQVAKVADLLRHHATKGLLELYIVLRIFESALGKCEELLDHDRMTFRIPAFAGIGQERLNLKELRDIKRRGFGRAVDGIVIVERGEDLGVVLTMHQRFG